MIPHGDSYFMSSAQDLRSSSAQADAVLTFFREMTMASAPRVVIEGGGGPERVEVVCGFLGCDIRPFNPVLASLPRVVHLRPQTAKGSERLAQLIEFALAESREGTSAQNPCSCISAKFCSSSCPPVSRDPHVGSYGVARRLARSPRRARPRSAARSTGRFVVARTPRKGDWDFALGARGPIHSSRGTAAHALSTQWRLQLAAGMLADGAAKVSAVAQDVGYDSEAAFSRAFKKFVGISPAAWRQQSTAS